ncbi:MAG: hypothetical protein ABSG93_08635 [Solirubrobacteraceae bacterium]
MLKKRLLIGFAVVAVLAGVTAAAVMAAQPAARHHRGGVLATAAGYLGLSTAQLRSDLQSGKSLAEVADARSGKSEAGLIAALEATGKKHLAADAERLPRLITAEVDRVGVPTAARERGRGRVLSTAASYLGVGAPQLRAELRAGKTLAQVADATSGKSEAGLIEALVAARKATLTKAVTAGKITQAQANVALPNLLRRATAQVNRVHRQHGSQANASARRRRATKSAGTP